MKTFLRLLSFLRPAVGQVALSVLAGIATIAAGVGLLGTSAYLIASAALHPSIADLQVAIVGVRFFGISRGVFRYLERLISHSVNLKVLAEIRVWFYQAIEPLAPARLQSIHSGDLLQRAMGDIETLENFYVRCISPVVVAIITGALACGFLGTIFPPLSGILAVGLGMNGIILPAFMLIASKRNAKILVAARAESSAGMVDFIQNLGVLQLFGAQTATLEKTMKDADRYSRRIQSNRSMNALSDGSGLLISNLTLLGVLWAIIPSIRSGVVSGVLLAVVTLATLASFEGATPLPLAAQQLDASLEAAKRLFDLANQHQPQVPHTFAKVPAVEPSELQISRLSFAYTSDAAQALRDVSFTLRRGQKTALVGPSGAGKSSVVNLILRFWQPDDGSIMLDGTDIFDLDEDWLRGQFGLVSPSSACFNISLRENLLLAKPDASDGELVDALGQVNLESWWRGLPNGLETLLGEQGATLSAGERQRIAIARVVLQKPSFLLLDEPVVNLDPANSVSIMQMLFRVAADSGILYITHDILHLTGMDEILLIEDGIVTERGSFSGLVTLKGRFAKMLEIQTDSLPVDH